MKRTILLSSLFTLILCTFLFSAQLEFGPYLQAPTKNGITILWETTEPVIGKVTYGTPPDQLTSVKTENSPSILHKIVLTGLEPNTTYFYQCLWENHQTEVFQFKTAPADQHTPFRIAVVADSRTNPDIFKKICQQIEKYEPDIILHSGDLVAAGNQIDQWKPQFFDPAKDLISKTPVYPSLGNHEQKAGYYYEHFTVHDGKPWWSADYGSVHLIGLNTSEDGSPGSAQYDWLIEDLQQSQNKPWRIALFHYPLFHGSPRRPVYDIRYHWTPLLIDHHVQFVITGHDHYYMRSYRIGNISENQQGMIHLISAGGGAPLYDFTEKEFSAYAKSIHHFVIMDVTEDKIEGKAISIDNEVFDTFAYEKGKRTAPENFIEFNMFELEQRVKFTLANVEPSMVQGDKLQFDTNFVVKTNFGIPTKGYYHWDAPDNWNFAPPRKLAFQLFPGEPLVIPFQAEVNADQMLPSPILRLHLEADTESMNTDSTAARFKNSDIAVRLDEAYYARAINVTSANIDHVLFFLKYFSASEFADKVVNQLGVMISQASNDIDLSVIDGFLEHNNTPENKYRFYPFYFIKRDYSQLKEWAKLAQEFAPDKIDLSHQLIYRLTLRRDFPVHTIRDWQLLGPFDNTDHDVLNKDFEPETNLDLSKTYSVMNNSNANWIKAETNRFGLMSLMEQFEPGEDVMCYAYISLDTENDGEVLFLFGSDDGAAIWVNGQKYFHKDIGRSARPCDDIIPVKLQKGKNDVLIKIAQMSGDWGFYLQVLDYDQILTTTD